MPTVRAPTTPQSKLETRIKVHNLTAGYQQRQVLKPLALEVADQSVTAIMGPSGCGKSTFLRCLNRMHEENPGAWAQGLVEVEGQDVYARDVDPVEIRRKIGMVFQQPNPFPTFSIYNNVAVGPKLNGLRKRSLLYERVEKSLRRAALWDEVKDRLHQPGTSLSGGQQQRLCIARALAVEPEILLLDEPCSALDPVATQSVEDLLIELKRDHTIVLVTHNIQQAARVADRIVFLLLGELVEEGDTVQIFHRPKDPRTQEFITGRFG